MSLRRWLILIASFAATIGASVYIVWKGWAQGGAPPAIPLTVHAIAFAAVLAEVVTRTIKLQWSAGALRIPLRFWTSMRVCLGGDFAASVTPARSGAEPARFLVLAEDGVQPAPALLILFTELLLETWSLALLCGVFLVAFRGEGRVLGLMTGMIGGYAMVVLATGAAAYALATTHAKGPPPAWAAGVGLHAGRWRAVQRALRSLRANLGALRHAAWGPMLAAFMASIVHVTLRLSILPVVARALDPSLGFAALVLWPLVFLYGGAVAPAPGGGGAVEFGFQFAYAGTMTPAVLGGALLWWRFYTFYLYVILGGLSVGGTVLKALRGQRHGRLHERAAHHQSS